MDECLAKYYAHIKELVHHAESYHNQIKDLELRISIEEEKDYIMQYLLASRSYYEDKITECKRRIRRIHERINYINNKITSKLN